MKKTFSILVTAFTILTLLSCTVQRALNNSQSTSQSLSSSTQEKSSGYGTSSNRLTAADVTTASTDINETVTVTTTSLVTSQTNTPENIFYTPSDSDFVKIRDYIPSIYIYLPYATDNNFTKTVIYDFDEPFLRYGTVKKLINVQTELEKDGLSLMIYDGFRPVSAQFKLWNAFPDPTFVSNPNKGYSSHSKGNTVDLTIVTKDGDMLEMPCEFDSFSSLADRDYSDCSENAAKNALRLENLMKEFGFKPYSAEWWHFTDFNSYPVEKELDIFNAQIYSAKCENYITLRSLPSLSGAEILKIPSRSRFTVYGQSGNFYLVNYKGIYGYVLKDYTKKQ